jgi:DNA-binding response OmpR family regulator
MVERADEGPAPAPEQESELMAKRILVVDDEPDIRRLVAEALEVTGYDVQTAANGEEAIRAASLFIPDLVLLDIMMPDMDGFAVYERLRARPVDLRSPIIFLTARREINDKLLGFEKGAADYITKPFHIKELLARVKVHLGELGPPKGDIPNPLTDRELEVLGLLASGKTYKQVARALDLSQSTVRNHLHNVYHKLNVVDRAQAVIVSRENGWI